MPIPDIIKGEEHFFVTKYEGNGGGQKVGKFLPFTNSGTIDNSCLFENNVSSYLSRTLSSNGSGTTLTFSCWVKRDILTQGLIGSVIMMHSNISSNSEILQFDSSDRLHYYEVTSGSRKWNYISNRTFEDTSKWYHIYVRRDTTDTTAADRIQIYVDGERITSWNTETQPSLNDTGYWNQTTYAAVVGNTNSGSYIDGAGYLAEVNMVDGSNPAISTFGLTDTSTGRWIPKTLTGITYGTNGFRLKFQDSSALGDDTSGNTNDFTATNLASTDQTTDSPSQNHATFDPKRNGGGWTLSEGNLKIVGTPSTGAGRMCLSGMSIPNSSKIYWEVEADAINDSPRYLGIFRDTVSLTASSSTADMRWLSIRNGGATDGQFWDGKSVNSGLVTTTSGDIIQFARDGEKLWIGKNNTWLNSGNPSTGANPLVTNIDTNSNWKMGVWSLSTGLGGASHTFIMNAGQRTFSYTPPTGFSAWNQDNLPETGKGIPDFMQIKNRDAADRWCWQDTLRGFGEYGSSASGSPGSPVQFNSAISDGAQKSLKGGFAVEDSDYVNSSRESYVSFNWVANNGVSATDSSGNMPCELQANPTAGFSIAKFTVNGTGVRTWAHGLGKTPEFGHLWVYNSTPYGTTYHHKMSATPAQNYTLMSSSQARAGFTNGWGTSGPSSTLWSGTTGQLFSNGVPYIFYSYVGIPGYSKFDSYVGNGNANGPFVYLGFKPRYIWIKNTSATSNYAFDTVRFPNNPNGENVVYDGAYSEASTNNEVIDFLSNGFKIRTTSAGTNTNGTTYIYGAFAEHPFIGDGTSPATAR